MNLSKREFTQERSIFLSPFNGLCLRGAKEAQGFPVLAQTQTLLAQVLSSCWCHFPGICWKEETKFLGQSWAMMKRALKKRGVLDFGGNK